MKTQPLLPEYKDWIEEHLFIFKSATSVTQPQREKVYEIYNHLYLDKKRPTGCGRCFTNVKTLVYHEYLKQSLLQ